MRIGIGTDLHRLEPGDSLMIGGVAVPSDVRAVGHSDADALLHALTDALLGAIAAGDIGEWFPDTDPANAGLDSRTMLAAAWREVQSRGFRLVNLDAVVQLERPKHSPHRGEIRASLARELGCSESQVFVKAKTGERLAPIGTREAIATTVVVLLESESA